jgi:hypothetical protein
VLLGRATGLSGSCRHLTEGKLIFLGKAFYLSKGKNDVSFSSHEVILTLVPLHSLFNLLSILHYKGVSSFRLKLQVLLT